MLKLLALLFLSISIHGAELYHEEFVGPGNNASVSNVAWKIWRRNPASGLIEDGTADTSGTRATLGKGVAYGDHFYNGHNTAEHPVLAWTEELPMRSADMTPTDFSLRSYNLNTVPTTQIALRLGGIWYLHSQTFANDPDDIGVYRTHTMNVGSGSWNILNIAIGQPPSVGATAPLPQGDIQAIGLYLIGEPDNTQTTGQTQHRIDTLWVNGALHVSPGTMMTSVTTGVAANQIPTITLRATNVVTQVILQSTTNLTTWANVSTNIPATNSTVTVTQAIPAGSPPFKAFRIQVP